jgi:hypothetical protein
MEYRLFTIVRYNYRDYNTYKPCVFQQPQQPVTCNVHVAGGPVTAID